MIASSITDTSIIGSDTERNVSAMIMNIAAIESMLTTLKSWFVISIKSLVAGASPMSIESSSYFSTISFNCATCSFTASDATSYSEPISINCHSSPLRISLISSGIISSGIAEPTSESNPIANLTPSTLSISLSIFLACFESISESTRRICVLFMLKSSASFVFATTLSRLFGRVLSSL